MTWADATAWVGLLNIGGVRGWRLPSLSPVNGVSFDEVFSNNGTTDQGYGATGHGWKTTGGRYVSEMGWMYYGNLGNPGCTSGGGGASGCTVQSDIGLVRTGSFANVQPDFYWSAVEFDPSDAWYFYFDSGTQNGTGKGSFLFAWAVHSGDVGVNPVPLTGAVVLMGSALFSLVGFHRSRRRAEPVKADCRSPCFAAD